jgi:transketolase
MRETMRDQMVETLNRLLGQDERLVVVLGNISATQLHPTRLSYPDRVLDVGILEQAMVSTAAGMAMEGLLPVVHTIAPFLAERAFEQLKDDFCYQRVGGNFVTIGASYDYSEEGMTHHAPGDVQILRSLPGMEIAVPGTPAEFDTLFRAAYADEAPTYFRLSTHRHGEVLPVHFGRATVVREGHRAAVIAVGPMLSPTLAAVQGLDVAVLYYTTVAPFDGETLRAHCRTGKVALIEPFYAGTLTTAIMAALAPRPVRIEAIGVPATILSHYGTPEQHDEALGLTPATIRARIQALLQE